MKLLILILLIYSSVTAQYKLADKSLIQMTAERELDNSLLDSYLNSDSSDSVSAALLTISHSRDTNYIPIVTSLNFTKHSEHILFTLGQLGPCKTSVDYLQDRLLNAELDSAMRQNVYATFGKVSDSLTGFNLLASTSFKPGIGYAVANYFMRGIDIPTSRQYLGQAIIYENKNSLFEILYCLYRITPDSSDYNKLIELLKYKDSLISAEIKSYAIGCMRKIGKYPDDEFGLSLLKNDDWKIRVEALKAAVNSSFSSRTEVDLYFQLLLDKNPNVSRTAALSIRSINFKKNQFDYIKNKITDAILNDELTNNTRGELFVTLCNLYPQDVRKLLDLYSNNIDNQYIYQTISIAEENDKWKFEYIKRNIPNASEQKLLPLLNPLLSLQNSFKGEADYAKVISTILKSGYPAAISIIADGLDSIFIHNNADILQQIVFENIFEYYNDAEFVESIFSLTNLSKKISDSFEKSVLEMIYNSSLYSVRNFASARLALEDKRPKIIPDLDTMIDLAFEYSSALIKTNKGNFRIRFTPDVAPISVGNFCLLASQDYFDDVIYHRVVPNFVIQTGDPSGTGWGGPGYEITSEFSTKEYKRGIVGMASAGPNTEGSQWFVMHNNYPHLNGRYSVFGEVIDGMNIVDIIDQGDKIISVELEKD